MGERKACVFCLRPVADNADWELNATVTDAQVEAGNSPYAYLDTLCWEPEGDDCLGRLADSGRPTTLGMALGQLQAAEQQRDRLLEAVAEHRKYDIGEGALYETAAAIEGERDA